MKKIILSIIILIILIVIFNNIRVENIKKNNSLSLNDTVFLTNRFKQNYLAKVKF